MDHSTGHDIPQDSPPVHGVMEIEAPQPGWPKAIGVISLIYAILGLCCAGFVGCSGFFSESLMKMGGMDVQVPMIVKVGGLVSGVLLAAIGVLMISGSVSLLRRRRSGVSMLKTWAILRIVMVLLGAVWTVATASAQVEMAHSVYEAQAKMMREHKQTPPDPPTDQELWRRTMLQVGIASVLLTAYPVFLYFYLARPSVNEESRRWV